MPSLSALGEFKSSFNNIANEKDDVEAKNLPFEDFALPDTEAPPFDPSADSASSYGSSDSSSDASDFDFSALLNSLPGDEGPPDIDSILSDSLGSPESGKAPDTGEDAFAVPDELLSGLPGEIESAVPDFDTQDSGMADFLNSIGGEDAQSEDAGIDMGGESPAMPGFDELPDNKAAADSGIDNEPDEGIDMGGEMPHEAVSQDLPPPETKKAVSNADPNSGGIDIGGESLDMGGESLDMGGESLDMGGESLDLGGESLDLGGEAPAGGKEAESDFSLDSLMSEPPSGGDAVSGADFSGFDSAPLDLGSGADLTPAAPLKDETPPAAVEDAGTFNLDDLGADFASESIPLGGDLETHSETDFGSGGYSAGDFGGDEFDLPGIEDIFDKQKSDTIAKPASKKGLFKKKKAKTEELPEAEENIDEISLTQGDVDSLLKTLSFYPLNLRIACEEIIAEQVILPQQLAKLIHLLVNGAPVKEAAAVVEEITGKAVVIPKSFEKMTGAAFEAEQSSFAYIFVHNFLPVLRLFAVIAALAASVVYLGYKFVYIPLRAESLYKRGYERIPAGEYQRANELFHDAFVLHRKKKWFYSYAEAFRDERRYMLAENKYDELLRYYPRDKKGVLDYANLETYYLLNYEKANRLLQRELLDFAPDDFDGLLAAGDNFLAWADSDPSRFYDRYEDARFSYARLLETYGWQVPVVERMMKYFIRTDNLKETLYLRAWFENGRNRRLSAESLSELGGYLLDKQLEKPSGVPNPYVESIESVRSMLLEAVRLEPTLPEPHYHLARYYNNLGNTYEERLTLENAIRAFDLAQTESVRRRRYRVDTHYRYANLLIDRRETFPAEEQLVRGIELYEDFLSRNLFPVSPQLGQLYAAKGDLEYFLKTGNMEAALANYRLAERYEYSPPEIQYRMGSANYQLENWGEALQYLFRASSELPLSRRLLYALGNAAYKRGDYFAAEGYYNRLLSILESQRIRLPVLLPNDSPQFHELAMRLMWARNNAGVVYEALAEQTGNREYRSRAMVLYAESSLAWDPLTRNPETMARMNLTGNFSAPGINLGYLNANNALRPSSNYMPQIFIDIDKDVLEPSRWEELAPAGGLIN